MIRIDAVGQPCPIPVVKAKQAIATLPAAGGLVQVLVDNRVACENLRKLADGKGYGYGLEETPEGHYAVTLTIGEGVQADDMPAQAASPLQAGGSIVAIGRDAMGHGDDALGKILIKGFIFSLSQLEVPPSAVLLFNGGVKLAMAGANTVDDLHVLAASGCPVLLCGTCVNFYELADQVAVGEITDMMGIAGWMCKGLPVVNL